MVRIQAVPCETSERPIAVYDYIIIGGGIVGLSTAWQLQQHQAQARILVLEKEREVGTHQTGRNAGVIHAGIYYEPGSLQAAFCHRGVEATMAFCRQQNIPHQQCGKLLVATNDAELARMETLFERCQQNDPTTRLLDAAELRGQEPLVTGKGAIFSPRTGIVDYREICAAMAKLFRADGGQLHCGERVSGIEEQDAHVTVRTEAERYECRFLIACSGLMGDRLARMQGIDIDFKLIPFKGEFYRIDPKLASGINHLVYPIPDPALPFLGVHLTRRINGDVIVGPNAVLTLDREGYDKHAFNFNDASEMLCYPGFRKLISKNMGAGLSELTTSLFKFAYVRHVRKYLPAITAADLQAYPPGIRAQPVTRDGNMISDFLFAGSPRSLHVCNAPSPAATAAIPIGEHISKVVLERSPQ